MPTSRDERYPQQPAGVRLLGSAQRLLLGTDGLRHLRYNFKFKKAAFALILLIMTMPTQVSALGFLQLISKMGLKNSFIL